MSDFDYVMDEVKQRLDKESDVERVREALKVTGVDWKMNEGGVKAQ